MSTKQNKVTDTGPNLGQKRPIMLGYTVRAIGDGQKSAWSKIAAAWAHKDGEGFEVRMDAMPVDGRLVLRTISENYEADSELVEPSPVG